MLSIYKFKIDRGVFTKICANVVQWLKVDWQIREKSFVAWALVDVDKEKGKERTFLIRGVETGEVLGDTALKGFGYIDTVNLDYYVCHFFAAEIDPETGDVMVDDEGHEPFIVYDNGNGVKIDNEGDIIYEL